jgi:hypothetical protein
LNSNQFICSVVAREGLRKYHKHSKRKFANHFGKEIQELTTSTNEAGDIKFIKGTDETVTVSLNAVAHVYGLH